MFDFTTKINSRLTADLHCTDSDVDRILMKNENRKLVLVGGKNGSNQKMSENKKFLIISVNLNPKCQVPNPKIAFYQNTLLFNVTLQKVLQICSTCLPNDGFALTTSIICCNVKPNLSTTASDSFATGLSKVL